MFLYPEHAAERLEFDKIKVLLNQRCRTTAARNRVQKLRFLSSKEQIERALAQTEEYRLIQEGADHFPNDFTGELQKELKLLTIQNAALPLEAFTVLRALSRNFKAITQWFKGRKDLFPQLFAVVAETPYEPEINRLITEIIDEEGQLRDDASPTLLQIRSDLSELRRQTRRSFEGQLRKYAALGYLSDIGESFLNGRRTLAVLAEYKRVVKGILHGQSDSQKTAFIEPESVIEFNNEIVQAEIRERKEIQRILADTTRQLAAYQGVLVQYFRIAGIYDFIRAKALLAQEMDARHPMISRHPGIRLVEARHPLLLLQNKQQGKTTVPLSLSLDQQKRILMISGPNAGGKTVAMKTVGLLQLMFQAGLLIPASPSSEMGIFQQFMVHIGDTQSIENELSTYSAHLQDMNAFLRHANARTLFFIDELGSGSDPDLGGAFAEAIVEEFVKKRALGIITTHYMNLKVMAGKIPHMVNGAMAFDEKQLLPLYQLVIGKPGSSYTFAIAKRIGLATSVIDRAQAIADSGHFKLDKILHETEKKALHLAHQETKLKKQIQENEDLKKQYEELSDRERKKQHFATLRLQNAIKKEELDYLRDMERKFKQIIQDWKKAENKQEVIQSAEKILFKKKQLQYNAAAAKKADKRFRVTGETPELGDLVRHVSNHQVGILVEVGDKKSIVKIGNLPFTVDLKDWMVVEEKKKKDR